MKAVKDIKDIKMVAVDVDGTFVRSDYTYDVPRFKRILERMDRVGCRFVVASGNQYYQLRDLFPGYYDELAFVAENGAFVKDRILKFAPTVPEEKTYEYYDMFCERLGGLVEPTTSGHGYIDLIGPGCHKASGLKRLAERWGIAPEQCATFGDGGNDIEMLQYCGRSYAMANAPENVKKAAKYVCPSNEEDGVLDVLEKMFAQAHPDNEK